MRVSSRMNNLIGQNFLPQDGADDIDSATCKLKDALLSVFRNLETERGTRIDKYYTVTHFYPSFNCCICCATINKSY